MRTTSSLPYLLCIIKCVFSLKLYHDPHFLPDHTGIVQLFEWTFKDVARECETFLGPKGYGGVQLSPVNEYPIVEGRPWYERYQPLSYKIISRSGDERQFRDMTRKCNAAGVRIYIDLVINHMAPDPKTGDPISKGIGGSLALPGQRFYPAVPYTIDDFNAPCTIIDYSNLTEVRNCELVGLHDLDQSKPNVRTKIIEFMNHLIELGVAGFRVDAASHMWPDDLKFIYESVSDLNPKHFFKRNARPFIYQETTIEKSDYVHLGMVTEFTYSYFITHAMRGIYPLKNYFDVGTTWGLVDSEDAIVFMDNHDTQRVYDTLTYKEPIQYCMGSSYMLAFPYGLPKIMSSFSYENSEQGPPQDHRGNILSPEPGKDGHCKNGWVCEHRRVCISGMVEFANVVKDTEVESFWGNDDGQMSFCRGNKGFIAFNSGSKDMSETLNTCLPSGTYCDVISGVRHRKGCTGTKISVNTNGKATISIQSNATNRVVAIHISSLI